MLKKLMSFLFEEEEEEVYNDEELEEAIFKDVPKTSMTPEKPVPQPRMEQPVMRPQPVQRTAAPQRPPVQKVVKEEPKRFTSIEIEPKKEMASGSQPVSRRRPIPADTPARSDKKSDFNFAPVISPIFGSGNEKSAAVAEKISDAIGTPKRKGSIDIISPMYGLNEPEEAANVKKAKNEGKRHAAAPKEEVQQEPVKETKLPDIPLEAMIRKDEDAEDDSMQISLFGEDAPIREAAPSDYKIEEE